MEYRADIMHPHSVHSHTQLYAHHISAATNCKWALTLGHSLPHRIKLWQPSVHNAHALQVQPEKADTFKKGRQLHVFGIQHILQVNHKMQSNCTSHLLLIPWFPGDSALWSQLYKLKSTPGKEGKGNRFKTWYKGSQSFSSFHQLILESCHHI